VQQIMLRNSPRCDQRPSDRKDEPVARTGVADGRPSAVISRGLAERRSISWQSGRAALPNASSQNCADPRFLLRKVPCVLRSLFCRDRRWAAR
jgi:hypothetical protein